MSYTDYPYAVDARGRTRSTSYGDHIRDMIEMVLFTVPGERVNRPNFGTGLLAFVFEPNNPTLSAALEATAQASLQYWLGDLIAVQALEVVAVDSTMSVTVQYVLLATGESQLAQVQRSVS